MCRFFSFFLLFLFLFIGLQQHQIKADSNEITNTDLSPYGECFEGFTPTFIRYIGTRQMDGPAFVAKIDMVTCSSHCRSNFDPASEEVFPCGGFNFRAGRNPVCEFFPATGVADKNATQSLKIEESPTFYYEKTCLKIAKRCEESAYMFDVKKGYRIEEVPNKIINISSVQQCMEECVNIQCQSFGFHHDAMRCSFYNLTRRDAIIIKDPKMDYFENNCIHPSARCPNGRIEFFVTRRADVPSFGLALGVKSIRSCMQSCVNNGQFYCRSIQFDAISNECFVSDETSDVAVPSATLDIYEPFCVPRNDENTCNRPYTYEKSITSKMLNITPIVELPNQSTEKCLQKCIDIDSCQSINYNVITRICALLEQSKTEGKVRSDENYDFYEMTCPKLITTKHFETPVTTTTTTSKTTEMTTTEGIGKYKLYERNREILEEFVMEQFTNIANELECWKLCIHLNCTFISYSPSLSSCIVSNSSLEISEITRDSAIYDLYVSADMTTTTSTITSTTTAKPTTTTVKVSNTSSEDNIFEFNELFDISEGKTTTEAVETSIGTTVTMKTTSTTTTTRTTTRPPTTTETPTTTTTTVVHRSRAHALPNTEAETEDKSLLPIDDPELGGLEDSQPMQMSEASGIAYVDPLLVDVSAQCQSQGINISFDLRNRANYTGVVYASERFEQCRVFVRNSSHFSIFIPRPKHNSWCNAVELNNEMSTIVILSNDRILPHDVTTKDDLFYQVSCQYNEKDEARVNQGIVVGGPSPTMITKKSQLEEKISLEITKEGKPVESVFVGESLMATVRSNISASSLRVVDCTAHRVGGPTPASVNLIADGCALLPSIMSPMKMTQNGWQSSLSAFRIDGSEQIDIVCILNVCEGDKSKCAEMKCPPTNERNARSLSNDETSVRVDKRLSVKVERHADGQLFQSICIEPNLYLPGIALFLCSLISIAISIFLTFRKNRRHDAQVEQLLHYRTTPIPTEIIGPKYMKTNDN